MSQPSPYGQPSPPADATGPGDGAERDAEDRYADRYEDAERVAPSPQQVADTSADSADRPVDDAPDNGRASDGPWIDGIRERLSGLSDRPVAEHAEVYDDLAEQLRGALTDPTTDPTGPHDPARGSGRSGGEQPGPPGGHRD